MPQMTDQEVIRRLVNGLNSIRRSYGNVVVNSRNTSLSVVVDSLLAQVNRNRVDRLAILLNRCMDEIEASAMGNDLMLDIHEELQSIKEEPK